MNLCLGGPSALCALRICRVCGVVPSCRTSIEPASPFPHSRWSKKLLIQALAPIPGLAEAMGDERITVCVPSRARRVQSRSVRNIVCSKASPKSSFVRANDALSFAAPELLLAHEAARLSPIDAALIAYELCGTYTLDPRTNTMVYGLEPVTSVADIQGFLRDMRGKVPGRKRLLNALEHVQDNSWSPMESVLALILSMPSSKGGFGLNNIVLNQRASSAGSSCSRVPDIVLGHSKVGINYEGETHFGTRAITDAAMHAASTTSLEALGEIQAAGAGMRSSIVRDKQRDRDLLLAGYKVIPATKEDLRTQEALDNLVWQLLQLEYDELGIARPTKSEVAGTYAVRAKRRALLRQLMHR